MRIDNAVSLLNYRPNVAARRLKRGLSETLGLAVTDIAYPFFAEIASAAEAEAEAAGFNLAIFNTRNRFEKEIEVLSKITDRQVDGLILLTNHVDDGRLGKAIASTGRVVLMDEDVNGVVAPRIFAENVNGGRIVTQHMIAHGHERIAFVGGNKELLSTKERFQGYMEGMAGAGFRIDSELTLFGDYHEDFGREAFRRLWDASIRPTAIVAAGDLLAIGILREAGERNIRVPMEVSLASFDDLPMASLLAPALTTVHQSPAEFGRRGVRALLNLIEQKVQVMTERIPVHLIKRSSVAQPYNTEASGDRS